jgi:hypothetical protein
MDQEVSMLIELWDVNGDVLPMLEIDENSQELFEIYQDEKGNYWLYNFVWGSDDPCDEDGEILESTASSRW